jgi:hypothetical protein
VIKLRCEEFDKLIHLFWDGELDEGKKEGLQKHLSTCHRCKEKLALLESVEKGAKGIKIKEPSQEYWDTFSNRVRERIIAQKEESFSFKLKKVFDNIFTFSPLKIKIAAGVVSIVFVFIVGKLYMDYRGREIVPSKPSIESKGEPALSTPEMTKEISPPEEKVRKEEKSVPSTKKTERASALKIVPREETLTVAEESKQETLVPETYSSGAGVEAEEKGMVSKTAIQPEHRAKEVEGIPSDEATKGAARKPSPMALDLVMETAPVRDYYLLEGERVLKVKEEDSLLQEDALRGIIESWNRYIEKNPKDSLTNQGYLQVATGYYLLTKLTHNQSDLLKGIEILERYEKQVTDPKIKEELNKKLKQLEALKEK